MNEPLAADVAIAGFALAAAVLYAAWYEYTDNNRRDARLLASVGAAGLLGSFWMWL